MHPSADALTAALLFRTDAGRNRNYALHASDVGAGARRRAKRLRNLLGQITGAFGPANRVSLEVHGDDVTLRYALAKLALARTARLSTVDLSILRVALARAGARLLPAALMARDDDRARVDALLASFADAQQTSARA